jgi:hypothetical protein
VLDCDYCVRISLSRRTPRADENGQLLSAGEVLERYNERRYQHYLDDFEDDELALAKHLNERTNHFVETAAEDDRAAIKATGFAANATTLAWWKRARLRDPETAQTAMKRDYEPTQEEIDDWMALAPKERFSRLKMQAARVGRSVDE